METQLVEYDLTEAKIEEMKAIYMPLVITDLNDKFQLDYVHQARMVVKGYRVNVEKRRKELKADALEYGKKVDARAKEIFSKLEPIEDHLMAEENKVLEVERKRKEEEARIEREKMEARVRALAQVGKIFSVLDVAPWTEEEYDKFLNRYTTIYQEKKAQEELEAQQRKAEAERLERVQIEQEIEQKRIEAATKELADKQREFEQEKARIAHDEAVKKASEEARIKAIAEEKLRVEREAAAKLAREKAEAEEKARKEALKPDTEKLLAYGNALMAVPKPDIQDKKAKEILDDASALVYAILAKIGRRVKEL